MERGGRARLPRTPRDRARPSRREGTGPAGTTATSPGRTRAAFAPTDLDSYATPAGGDAPEVASAPDKSTQHSLTQRENSIVAS